MLEASPRPMTARQAEIHRWMLVYQQANRKPPTVRSLCKAFGGMNVNGMMNHLRFIAKKGFFETSDAGESRRYRAVVPSGRPSPVDELTLELCAASFNRHRWKQADEWRRDGDRLVNDDGDTYDATDANAIAYYLDHGQKGDRS